MKYLLPLVIFIIFSISVSGQSEAGDKIDKLAKLTTTIPSLSTEIQNASSDFEGNIDSVNGISPAKKISIITDKKYIDIRGWAINSKLEVSPDFVYIKFYSSSGQTFYALTSIMPREDIADHFKNKLLKNSGFVVAFDGTELPPGKYDIFVVLQTKTNVSLYNTAYALEIH